MSLHTIVADGLAGRLLQRPRRARVTVAVAQPRANDFAARLSGTSMRVLETSMALAAIGTALLIGLGR